MSPLYVYALVHREAPGAGRLATGLERVAMGPIAAIVERRAKVPELDEETLRRQHALVVALADQYDPLLPVRFGCLLDRDALQRSLREAEPDILRAFDRVRGCRQMTVRIFGRASRARMSTAARTGTAYLRACRAASRAALPPAGRAVQRAVSALVREERIDRGLGQLQVSLHHLVPARACPRYVRAVRTVASSREPGRVLVTGPWPAFAFAPEPWP